MRSKLKWVIMWLYCYRLVGFKLANKIIRKLKEF